MIRLAVRVRREHAELVLAELLELAPAGVEEVAAGEQVEYAVYGAPGELPSMPELKAAAGGALVEISTSEVRDDWAEGWRRFHRPVLVEPPQPRAGADRAVPALYVRPPWEAAGEARGGACADIVIDPAQAFGTGAHASTRLCLELLLALATQQSCRGPVLDVGTGSGVLAIAAARLGFAPVLGIDNERESIRAARANAESNGVQLKLLRHDLRAGAPPWPHPDAAAATTVLANLLAPLLLELELPTTPEHLIAGGLLPTQLPDVTRVLAGRLGMRETVRRERDGWAAVWLSGA